MEMDTRGLFSSNHRTQLADDERMIAAALGNQGVETSMEERFHNMVALPSHQSERNFPQPGGQRLRFLVAVEYDVDFMAATRQGFRHPEEADSRHRGKKVIRTVIANINARDAQPWPIGC
jgi:hypothetical protein